MLALPSLEMNRDRLAKKNKNHGSSKKSKRRRPAIAIIAEVATTDSNRPCEQTSCFRLECKPHRRGADGNHAKANLRL